MIRARVYSDCRTVNITFDATPWAEQATDADLIALGACDCMHDSAADAVAIFMAACDDKVAFLFKFLELVPEQPGTKETNGFDCEVNVQDLKDWVAKHKPALLNQIWKEEKLKPVNRAELFRKWVKYILHIHETEAWNKEKTPEEEAEDDKMVDIWNQIHPVDQIKLWDLSAHLHIVRLNPKDVLPPL